MRIDRGDDDTRLDDVRAISKKELGYLTIFKAGLGLQMTYASSDQVEVRKIVMVPKDCGL